MRWFDVVIVFCYALFLLSYQSEGQTTDSSDSNETVLNESSYYCFEFTWMGPRYDINRKYNGTCESYLESTRAKGTVPCSPPLVISENATPPDIDYLWDNHRTSVLCQKAKDQVCARYTYKLDGITVNTTYMCTTVQAVGESPVHSGMYVQKVDGYDIELFVCESKRGVYFPCNTGYKIKNTYVLFISIVLLVLIKI